MTLKDTILNNTSYIDSITCNDELKRRFLDLGLIKGTAISPILKSPLGDPIAYEFRGNIIAIRNDEAKKILVNSAPSEI